MCIKAKINAIILMSKFFLITVHIFECTSRHVHVCTWCMYMYVCMYVHVLECVHVCTCTCVPHPQGCLVCSHLPPFLLQPVAQLAHTNQLLTTSASQPLTHTTVWQEVYLARDGQEEQGRGKYVYRETYGRTFVLIIAMVSYIQCTVYSHIG